LCHNLVKAATAGIKREMWRRDNQCNDTQYNGIKR
jgi:hypothetical protein